VAEEASALEDPPVAEEVPVAEDSPVAEDAPAAEEASGIELEEPAPNAVANLDDWWGYGCKEEEKDWCPAEPSEVELRVSSRHLILASPYFKAALSGPWREAVSISADCSRCIYADDWDPEALLILMDIIHSRNRRVPRRVSLELLAKIAVLVDYYQCHEAVEVFAEIWLQKLKDDVPAKINRELVLWLCVSWVFSNAEVFASVTSIAVHQSLEPLPTLGLPIPGKIVGKYLSRASPFSS
jgi:hypothetical protein